MTLHQRFIGVYSHFLVSHFPSETFPVKTFPGNTFPSRKCIMISACSSSMDDFASFITDRWFAAHYRT